MQKPSRKPVNPCFSSGPCAKRPGWSLEALSGAFLGRSHRASAPKARLKEVIDLHKSLLGIPADYRVGIVPASDTGAVEMALWSMLGARGVDVLAWESFSEEWLKDITNQLKLPDVRTFTAPYGGIPDLSQADPARDIVFVWNGTTSGVRVPDADWISDKREGLTICDATSAVFAYDLPWKKLDVVTWSWQKVLGGEAAHGMIALSPRAVKRLETYVPPRPLPKIFRMTSKGKISEGIFTGDTINTPSMLAVEDCVDALRWVERLGGLRATIARSAANLAAVEQWVAQSGWADFLAEKADIRSATSVCLKVTDSWFVSQSIEKQSALINELCKLVEKDGAGYDIKSYRDAPPGLRIWCGATVEAEDIEALLPWLDWAYESVKNTDQSKAA
ncbi:MAG: phosphoserine transaminase [Alphaproteobacteria bacterium]|nr:phosphoserine transaminase [Alphaproteobacteria bacterium]